MDTALYSSLVHQPHIIFYLCTSRQIFIVFWATKPSSAKRCACRSMWQASHFCVRKDKQDCAESTEKYEIWSDKDFERLFKMQWKHLICVSKDGVNVMWRLSRIQVQLVVSKHSNVWKRQIWISGLYLGHLLLTHSTFSIIKNAVRKNNETTKDINHLMHYHLRW